jgi:predicted RNase H-like HicB family nuclease
MAISGTSKSATASVKKRRRIDRPFAPSILKRAREAVGRYQVVIRFDQDEGEYYGRGLELPNALGDGATPAACLESTKESMVAVVAFMLERGESPPPPASDEARLVQLNVRISPGEKLMFEEAARQRGQALSEFIRSAALERVK